MKLSADYRLVVFTGDLSYTVRRNIVDLDSQLPGLSWLILVHAPGRTLAKLVKSQRFNLRKHGWRWLTYQFVETLSRLASSGMPAADPQAPGGEYELESLLQRSNVRVVRVNDIHAESNLTLVRDFGPDLALSLAAPILKPALFTIPRLGTINLHKGKLPEFRGMPPAFWELWSNQTSVGCSVHRVNDKLDAGELLAKSTVPCERFSTQRGLQVRLDEIGSELICNVAYRILSGQVPALSQPMGDGQTWRKPSLAQEAVLEARYKRLLPHTQPRWKRYLKDTLAWAEFGWHHWIGWRWSAPRITVLLYHRVCDDARDNLSVGVAQFERQMRLLRKHCNVLSIEQLLASECLQRSRRPVVAVSFDDGYLDNYLNATPILRRHRVPCSFYVSTGMLDSDRSFPHDQRRGNAPIPTMNWEHLREMQAWGYTIGSHTVNHIDCVAESESTVRQELLQSRVDLERELGRIDPIFAYPYGGRHQMNAARRILVREAGYQSCLAAYGGSNIGEVDRWNVQRRGIHWEHSDAAFLRQCLGH